MAFVPFEMERWQSLNEHVVDVDLSESGVRPPTLAELLDLLGLAPDFLHDVQLRYIQSNGTVALREHIAAFHPGAEVDGIVVTNGSAEANFVAAWEFCRPGSEVVFMEPNYFQIHGIAENLGATVREWWLDAERGFQPDLAALEELVNERTALIVVTSPNNPTGLRFDDAFVEGVVSAAEKVGAWILSDEVYRGGERDGVESPTFSGRYDKVIVTGGLSKAYGLPGLRIGWAVTEAALAARLWARTDYTTIAAGALSDPLATAVLATDNRGLVLGRTRAILQENWEIMQGWLEEREDMFSFTPPDAGAIVLARAKDGMDSAAFAERLRAEQSCLLVPGAQFNLPEYLRIGFGPPPERLREGLRRVATVADSWRPAAPAKV